MIVLSRNGGHLGWNRRGLLLGVMTLLNRVSRLEILDWWRLLELLLWRLAVRLSWWWLSWAGHRL
jgi:hypothetical protein